MGRRILIVSPTQPLVDNVEAIAQRFSSVKTLHVTSADYVKDYTVNSETLIILDNSSKFSSKDREFFLLWAQSERTRTGAGVLRVDPTTSIAARPEIAPDGYDALVSDDFLRLDEWPKFVIRLLYRRFVSGTVRITDSEDVFRLMPEALDALFPHLQIGLYELLFGDADEKTQLVTLLADVLTKTSTSMKGLDTPRISRQPGWIEVLESWPRLALTWYGLYSQIAAIATYYFLLAAASRSLRAQSQFSVPVIGTFHFVSNHITFSPTAEFRELIDSNPLEKVVSARS